MDESVEFLVRFEINLSQQLSTVSNLFAYLLVVVRQRSLTAVENVNQSYQFALYFIVDEIDLMTFVTLVEVLFSEFQLRCDSGQMTFHLPSLKIEFLDVVSDTTTEFFEFVLPVVKVAFDTEDKRCSRISIEKKDVLREFFGRGVLIGTRSCFNATHQTVVVSVRPATTAEHSLSTGYLMVMEVPPILRRVANVERGSSIRRDGGHSYRIVMDEMRLGVCWLCLNRGGHRGRNPQRWSTTDLIKCHGDSVDWQGVPEQSGWRNRSDVPLGKNNDRFIGTFLAVNMHRARRYRSRINTSSCTVRFWRENLSTWQSAKRRARADILRLATDQAHVDIPRRSLSRTKKNCKHSAFFPKRRKRNVERLIEHPMCQLTDDLFRSLFCSNWLDYRLALRVPHATDVNDSIARNPICFPLTEKSE